MALNRQIVTLGLVMFMTLGPLSAKASAQETLFGSVTKAVSSVFDAVGNWNKAIDKLTNVEGRKQLQRRMFRLHREMQELERKKQNLLESILADRFIRDNVSADIDELRGHIQDIRRLLDQISGTLGSQESFDGQRFENLMNHDLNDKAAVLIVAKAEGDRTKLIAEVQNAIAKISEARKAVGDCLKNLEKDL